MNRQEEESALWPEEREQLETAVNGFLSGQYGYYGSPREPGLIPRLESIQTFWDTRREMEGRIGAQVKEWESFEATITMPAAELYALHRHVDHQLANMGIEADEIARGEFSPARVRDHVMKKFFLADMKKVCERASKKVTEARLAIIEHREPDYSKDDEEEDETTDQT